MTEIDLSKVNLGSPAAERDSGLDQYFVRSDAFRRVADGSKRIVIGNRGAGKSAIFQFLASEHRRKTSTSVIELSPEDYSYELLRETMATEAEGSWQKQSAYGAAWKYLLYVLVMKSLASEIPGGSRGSSLAKIKRYVRDNHQGGQNGALDALISYLKRLEGVKIGPYEAGVKTRELQKLYKLEEISMLLPCLEEVLRNHTVVIFVDELDRGWDAGEDAQAFVAGLFQACLALNGVSKNLRLYMSLRQELYENIPALYEDAQKVRDLIENVRWDEPGLKKLLVERLRHSISEVGQAGSSTELEEDEVWNSIFTETLAYRQTNSFNYVVDRTLYRPREIIQFCTQIIESGITLDTQAPLDYPVFVEAEHIYSEDRAKDIAAEYRFQYPGLLKVFEAFRGHTYTFDREELEELCTEIIISDRKTVDEMEWISPLEPEELIERLWRVGFLRAQAVGGIKGRHRSGSQYVGAYQVGSLDLAGIMRFQVHPLYRSWLAMREPKGTK